MADIRKYIIVLVIAILYAVLVFASIDAFYAEPKHEDYCDFSRYAKPMPYVKDTTQCEELNVSMSFQEDCRDKGGYIDYEYSSLGCPSSAFCETCQHDYDEAMQKHKQYIFYISAIFALIAIFVGLYLPVEKNSLNEWIGTGFMLGGAFALIFGTASSFTSLDRMIRPVVILLELALVIFISYRKIGDNRQTQKHKKIEKKV